MRHLAMKRRTWIRTLAAAFVSRPIFGLRLFARQAELPRENIAALSAIAEVALPAAIGVTGRDKAVADFVAWVRNYKEGADTGHSYGASTLARPTGASPAARYPPQFAALDKAAGDQGAASFVALSLEKRRVVIEAMLSTPQPVMRLPARPTGANLVADFMGLYFNSGDAFDLCYRAEIGRDNCRTLDGSDLPPRPLTTGGR
jgi:hypothetical protein